MQINQTIMKKCKICGNDTAVGFILDFKLVPICEDCARVIFLQQAKYYAETNVSGHIKLSCIAAKGECDRKPEDVCPECEGCRHLEKTNVI